MADRVRVVDGSEGIERRVFYSALHRLMGAPLARDLCKRFIEEGVIACVAFVSLSNGAGETSNRGPAWNPMRGSAAWVSDCLHLKFDPGYLHVDQYLRDRQFPPVAAHELLGHGLWYARAARQGILQGMHHHDKNEAYARLVTWMVDEQLGIRSRREEARQYLADPQAALDKLKSKTPYYALTFSSEEMCDPVRALKGRLAGFRDEVGRLASALADAEHSPPTATRAASETEIVDPCSGTRRRHPSELTDILVARETLAEIVRNVETALARFESEPDETSARYLRSIAAHPLVKSLEKEARGLASALSALVQGPTCRI